VTPLNGSPYGAREAEWAWATSVIGVEDLLPVVSNPAVPVSPNSKIKAVGKVPSMLNRMGQATGIKDWPQIKPTAAEVRGWQRNPNLGICVQTRGAFKAIDVDITKAEIVQQVMSITGMVVGQLPMRARPNSTKCLLVLRLPGDYSKRVIKTAAGNIEFLATGQQFIAAGTHTSGARYEWPGGLPAVIPEVSPAEFEALWQGLQASLGVEAAATARSTVRPTVERVAGDANDPLVDWLADQGWVRSWGADGVAHIRCPFEAEHTDGPDGSETASSYFPRGVGGFELGHFKCLHAHCIGRTDQQFLDGLGLTIADEFTPVPEAPVPAVVPASETASSDWPEPGPMPALDRTGRGGTPAPTLANAKALIERPDLLRLRVAYDAFRDMTVVARPDHENGAWKPFADTDYFRFACAYESLGVRLGRETVRDAVKWAAEENTYDSALQWATGLVWDGMPRIETFLIRYLGCADTPYHRAVARYLWTALAGRCISPGCQADMVPVFISRQGTGKTTLVESLAPTPEMFAEISLEHRDVDLARKLRGKLVAELSELRGLAGKDAEAIRAWLTSKAEEWIPKYQEYATVYQRRFIVVGTTNTEEFLADDTGERRWLPVRVGATDREAIRRDCEQLWAEGLVEYRARGVQWQDAEVLAQQVHAEHKVRDPWEPVIAAWLDQGPMDGAGGVPRSLAPVRLVDVLVSAVGLNVKEITRTQELRVARVLRHLGYEKHNMRVENSGSPSEVVGGRVVKAWFSEGARVLHSGVALPKGQLKH
jgi:predicted P-loop ATPase